MSTTGRSDALEGDAEEEVALAMEEAVGLPDGQHGAELGGHARLLRHLPLRRVPGIGRSIRHHTRCKLAEHLEQTAMLHIRIPQSKS